MTMMQMLLMATSSLTPLPDAYLDLDFASNSYRLADTASSYDAAFVGASPKLTYATTSNSTMVDSSGNLVWAPHNLVDYSEDFEQWSGNVGVTLDSSTATDPLGGFTASTYSGFSVGTNSRLSEVFIAARNFKCTFAIWLKGTAGETIELELDTNGAAENEITFTGSWQLETISNDNPTTGRVRIINRSNSADVVSVWGAHVYRSDLGGMAPVPGAATGFETYVPTNGSAEYLPRVGHHVYDTTTSAWVNEGLLLESEARTNLLLSTATLSTQSATVTAVPHTLSFTGTGTVTLSGVSTDGPLVGTGTGENNRVNLTFTPTAGTLTLTVSGTVSNAQLEVGSTPSSYMPSNATTQGSRAAQTLDVPPAEFGWNSSGMSFAMEGRMTYTDNGTGANINSGDHQFFSISQSLTNYILHGISTSASRTGQPIAEQRSTAQNGVSGVRISSLGGGQDFAPGVLVPYNVSARHSTAGVQGANEGTANSFTATPTDKVTLADLSNESLEFGVKYMGTIRQFRQWDEDIGETGIEEASS